MVGAVGGEQILNMGDGCQYVGLVLHEFGHAIGYFHEHNRPDRDDVVDIMWDNIQYGKKKCFIFIFLKQRFIFIKGVFQNREILDHRCK